MNSRGVDDPLFRAVDADDFVARGDAANDFRHVREAGLIRIRMKLPANIKLVDPSSCQTAGAPAPCETAETYAVSSATFTDVWRGVPSVTNLALTGADPNASSWPRGPNVNGGYQLDGRVDTLENQAKAAFRDHAQVTTMPADAQVEDLVAYEQGLKGPDEPPLDALQTEGKAIFKRACTQCHGGPGLSTSLHDATQDIVRYFDDLADCPRSVDTVSPPRWTFDACAPGLERDRQTYEISFADGFKRRRTTTDPGRALLTGYVVSSVPGPGGTCAHAPCGQEFQDDCRSWTSRRCTASARRRRTFTTTARRRWRTSPSTTRRFSSASRRCFRLRSFRRRSRPTGSTPTARTSPSERAALVAYLKTL